MLHWSNFPSGADLTQTCCDVLSHVGSEDESLKSVQETELTLRGLLDIYRKRRRVLYGTILLFGVLGSIYCAVSTRRYEAKGIIQIQKEASDGMGLDSMMSEAGSASDSLETNVIIQTQINILQSDTLALRTVEKLHMEGTKDFVPHWSPLSPIYWGLSLFSPKGIPDPQGARLEDAPARRQHVLNVFLKNLKVKPVTGTRLIEIDYLNPDPKLAASVVNELTQALADYTFQTRYDATNQASSWLAGQLSDLRKASADLQAKVVSQQRESGVYSLGTVDASGKEIAYSGVLDQLQQATAELSQAQQNRILKGAIAQAAKTGNAELLSGLSGNSMAGAGGSTPLNNSLTLIQNLRQQESSQQARLREAEAKYGPEYPKLAELRANLAGVERSIKDEVERVKARAESDSAVAIQIENNTRKKYEQAKQAADDLNNKGIDYAITRQEAEGSRLLYEDLLRRLKEAGVLEGLKSSNVTVVDPGRVPAKPKKPNVPLYMLVALGGGLFAGSLIVLLVDTLDNKIGGTRDVEELLGESVLGATPEYVITPTSQAQSGDRGLVSLIEPNSTYTEAVRAIRTAVLLTGGGEHSRVILITSSIPGEGKTTLAANFAVVLSQSGKKVLLVDMDLRRGTLGYRMGLSASSGLSALLSGQSREPELSSIKAVPELDILQAGAHPPNPSELLESKIGEAISSWREKYDMIVIDGAPMLPVTDSNIVNPFVDITLLLARSGLTERPQLQRSYQMLKQGSDHFVGVVLNGLRPEDDSYYGYYGYRKYAYHYGEDDDAKSE
jgi:capsular exopolysaccharide synthesis family protein